MATLVQQKIFILWNSLYNHHHHHHRHYQPQHNQHHHNDHHHHHHLAGPRQLYHRAAAYAAYDCHHYADVGLSRNKHENISDDSQLQRLSRLFVGGGGRWERCFLLFTQSLQRLRPATLTSIQLPLSLSLSRSLLSQLVHHLLVLPCLPFLLLAPSYPTLTN